MAPDPADLFVKHQFAIGISGGIDFIMHAVMQIIAARMDPDLELISCFALLVLDFRNMFNEISQLKACEELETHFPELLHLFDRLCPLSGNINCCIEPSAVVTGAFGKEKPKTICHTSTGLL